MKFRLSLYDIIIMLNNNFSRWMIMLLLYRIENILIVTRAFVWKSSLVPTVNFHDSAL